MTYRDEVIIERQRIYDKLSSALTDFETDVFDNNKYGTINFHIGNLYRVLVDIQNNWECVITAQID